MRRGNPRATGLAYIGLLVAIVIIGAALAAVGEVWTIQSQREREVELLFRGDALRTAIGYYVSVSPGSVARYPQDLQDLVQDPRWPQIKRYLRRVYEDPMTGAADWTLIRAPDGGIMGVASSSKDAPIKRQGFNGVDGLFADASCYCDWQFIYQPRGARFGLPIPAPTPAKPPTITGPHWSGRPP
jgi:type II secretory pathway pseudopilin PulG